MATLSTRELSKQPEKHEPPEKARKTNQQNEQCVRSIQSAHRELLLQILLAPGEFRNAAASEEKCAICSQNNSEWKDN
jgi:hypothetical protein